MAPLWSLERAPGVLESSVRKMRRNIIKQYQRRRSFLKRPRRNINIHLDHSVCSDCPCRSRWIRCLSNKSCGSSANLSGDCRRLSRRGSPVWLRHRHPQQQFAVSTRVQPLQALSDQRIISHVSCVSTQLTHSGGKSGDAGWGLWG